MVLSIRNGFLSLCLSSFVWAEAEKPFFDRHAEGWFWYHDPEIVEEEKDAEKKDTSSPASKVPDATKKIMAEKKEMEKVLHQALVQPTEQNVQNYMVKQQEMVKRSKMFSKTWERVVLMNPELNHEREFPTAQYARQRQDKDRETQKVEHIKSLSKQFGLFYFFQANCSYCEGFSPIVKMFSEKYQWDVLAVSLDGSKHQLFQTVPNTGMAEALDIRGVPALIAFNPHTNELIPISFAMMSLDRLEDNIMALTGDRQ